MQKITQKWIEFAKIDLKEAEILFKNKAYSGCIYHYHQSLEKYLKAIINENNQRVPKIHDLPKLLKESKTKYTKEILEFIEELNPYYNPVRYPDIAIDSPLQYNRNAANKILKFTNQVIKWLKYHLSQ